MRNRVVQLSFALLLFAHIPFSTLARPIVLVLTLDDLSDPTAAASNHDDVATNFDDFPDPESKSDYVLDPGSWSPQFELYPSFKSLNPEQVNYYSDVGKMVEAASRGDFRIMEDAVPEIEAAADSGDPHWQSVMGPLYEMGMGKEKSQEKAFLPHYFATLAYEVLETA